MPDTITVITAIIDMNIGSAKRLMDDRVRPFSVSLGDNANSTYWQGYIAALKDIRNGTYSPRSSSSLSPEL